MALVKYPHSANRARARVLETSTFLGKIQERVARIAKEPRQCWPINHEIYSRDLHYATLIASIARAQSTETMSLSQIQDLPRSINHLLNDRDYTDSEEADLIAKSRYDVELSIRSLMMAGIILPKDLANLAQVPLRPCRSRTI